MLRRLGVLVLAVALAGTSATAAPARPGAVQAKPTLRQLLKDIVKTGAPGAFVVIRTEKGTTRAAAGYANLRTKQLLRTTQAFRVGSVTKTFVATVVLQLVGEGVLSLDDNVERWLPGVVPKGQGITLRQLLNHTSGIFNYTDDNEFIAGLVTDRQHVWTPLQLVAVATSHQPSFPPGTFWSYSNTGYILLGLVIEKATGTTVEEQLRRRIFEPLALTRTSFPSLPTLPVPYAHGYMLPGNGAIPTPRGRPVDVSVWSPSWAWAAGAMISTADDLARFYRALLRGELLRPDLLAQMERTVAVEGSFRYGLALAVETLACGEAWGHSGGVPGYTTIAWSTKDGSKQMIAMVNATLASGTQGVRFGSLIESSFCR